MGSLQRLASLLHCDFLRASVTPLQHGVCPFIEEEAHVPWGIAVPSKRPTRAVLNHNLGGSTQEHINGMKIIDLMAGLDLNIHGDGDGLKIVVALFVDSLDGPVVGKAIP